MTLASITLAAIRAAVIFGVALASMRLLARASAATRRSVLVSAFAIVLVLPIATAVLPAIHLRGANAAPDTDALVAASTRDVISPASPGVTPSLTTPIAPDMAPRAGAPAATSLSPLALVLAVWAFGAVAVLARLSIGL